jgi:hypothetical protein
VIEGETAIDEPVPTRVPPQAPEYQAQSAPVPNVPPARLNVAASPSQIESTLVDALLAAAEFVLSVTVTFTQAVVSQVPSACT